MEDIIVFIVGAVGYSLLEIMWRGYTHWTMSLTGGVCLLLVYSMNDKINANLFVKCFIGAAIITIMELVVGYLVNIVLGWRVWDYSRMSFNFKGQICAFYSLIWFVLCIPLMRFCDVLKITFSKIL